MVSMSLNRVQLNGDYNAIVSIRKVSICRREPITEYILILLIYYGLDIILCLIVLLLLIKNNGFTITNRFCTFIWLY